jgi:hypothetical protein
LKELGDHYLIPSDEISFGNVLVKGGLGDVRLCTISRFPGETFAVKTYENAVPKDKSSLAAEKLYFAQMDAVVGEFCAEVRQLKYVGRHSLHSFIIASKTQQTCFNL